MQRCAGAEERLAAAGLLARKRDLEAALFEQLERREPGLRAQLIDVTRHEQGDVAHGGGG